MNELNSLPRREFLLTASAGLALAAASQAFGEDKPAKEMEFKKAVKIGMVTTGSTLLEKCKLLKELGFDGVELNAPGPYTVAEVKMCKAETGLDIPGVVDSVHWNQRLTDPDAGVRAKGLAALQDALKYCKEIGGTSVLLVPGRVTPDATYEQAWERSVAEIKKATTLAADLGIDILIENVWNDFLTEPKQMADFVDACESKMVGSYFDVGNAVRYSPPHEWIPILGRRIKKLDIKDYKKVPAGGNPGAGFSAKLLEGDVDWPKVMAELKKIGFYGWGTAEIQGGDRVWLTDVAARMDKIFAS